LIFAVSLSQLLLAIVFAVAGVAKLVDRGGTREAIESFGVSPRLAGPVAISLPVAELAIAAALLPAATARWGAIAAVVLLAGFSVAIARVLRAGATVDCNCFGGLTRSEVGRGTLIRNLALAAVALFVALSGVAVSGFRWITVPAPQDRLGIVLMIASVAGLAWFCWQLLQQNGRLLLRLEAVGAGAASAGSRTLPPLAAGAAAPRFSGHYLEGEPVSLDSLLAAGQPVVLFFTDPGCGACELVLGAVAQAQRERADQLTVAVISSGRIDRIEAKASEFGLDRVIPQSDEAVFDAFGLNGVPGVVEIAADGTLSRPAALGVDAVREVVLGPEPAPPHQRTGLAAK
jgi:uncharacterized membrane protein YphA (DoxX/SURF4 family)